MLADMFIDSRRDCMPEFSHSALIFGTDGKPGIISQCIVLCYQLVPLFDKLSLRLPGSLLLKPYRPSPCTGWYRREPITNKIQRTAVDILESTSIQSSRTGFSLFTSFSAP